MFNLKSINSKKFVAASNSLREVYEAMYVAGTFTAAHEAQYQAELKNLQAQYSIEIPEGCSIDNDVVERYPWVAELETLSHEEIMMSLMTWAKEVAALAPAETNVAGLKTSHKVKVYEILELQRAEIKKQQADVAIAITDILCYLEYNNEFVATVTENIINHMKNPLVNKLAMNPMPGYMINLMPASEEIALRPGVLFKKQFVDPRLNDVTAEYSKAGDVMFLEGLTAKTVKLLTVSRSGKCLIQMTENGKKVTKSVDEVNIRIGNRTLSECLDVTANEVAPLEPQSVVPFYHNKHGLMHILSITTDENGNEVFQAIPASNFEYIVGGELFYNVDQDGIGDEEVFVPDTLKPMSFYPCELIDPQTIKSDVTAAIKAAEHAPEYQLFSASDFTEPVYMKSSSGKTTKGTFEPTEENEPLAMSMEENVKVIKNLPRVERNVNGKIVKESPMVLAMGVETGKLFVTHASWLYLTTVPESFKVNVPKYECIQQLPAPKKRAYSYEKIAESFKKTKETEVELNLKMTGERQPLMKKFNVTKPIFFMKKGQAFIGGSHIKSFEVEIASVPVFEKANHKAYFDLVTTPRDLRYKFVDPKTQEVLTIEEIIVDEDVLITATKATYRPSSNDYTRSSGEEYIQDIIDEEEKVSSPAEHKVAFEAQLKQVLKDITGLGIASVEYNLLTKNRMTVTTKLPTGKSFDFQIVKLSTGIVVDKTFKMSDTATALFTKLASFVFPQTV